MCGVWSLCHRLLRRKQRPLLGKEQVLREGDSWLRIERYFEEEEPWVRFLPMLCQHCDDAPCESVCPMFAPNHSIEGLNNQVYNRCIGTFSVHRTPLQGRRFNWFTFSQARTAQLAAQSRRNRSTQRGDGEVFFCIQRIVDVKNRARNESRKARDGEVIPACVQTCPADALVFGNLRDPQSRVSKLIQTRGPTRSWTISTRSRGHLPKEIDT